MIPPGGEGEIKVTLHPKGNHPKISKNIVVHSNDPEQPRFTLTMTGTLLIDVVAQPPSVVLSNLAPKQAGIETFSVQRSEGSEATIKSVRIDDTELFSVRKTKTEPGALATYQVRFKGRKDVGVSATSVIVETTGDNTPELKIPVRASATYNLRYPKRFGFRVKDGEPPERMIAISTRRGDPPKINKVVDPDGLLDIEVLEPKGPITNIRARVREDAMDKAGEGTWHTLFVHTDDRDEPKLELQYRMTTGQTSPRRAAIGSVTPPRNESDQRGRSSGAR